MNDRERLRLLAITDEPVRGFGLERLLAHSPFLVSIARDLIAAEADLDRHRADIILVDEASWRQPEAIPRLRQRAPESRIALWARAFSEDAVFDARQSGIEAFVAFTSTPAKVLAELNRLASRGSSGGWPRKSVHLTPRENELTALLTQGMKNSEIAAAMGLSEGTVKSYVVRLLRKTRTRDRFELAIVGLKNTPSDRGMPEAPYHFARDLDDKRGRPVLIQMVRSANGGS